MRLVIALAAIAAPISAEASPIFLKCELQTRENGVQAIEVQLNEQANTASYSFVMDGETRSYNVGAVFTPSAVSFNSFTVNRVDLSFQRDNSGPFLKHSNWNPIDRGKCVVNDTRRAF